MGDNINDDTSDKQLIPELENLSGKIISTNVAETVTSKQETENMEVHHHPDLHHKPKKWKEYFLEFLMIFLAVTMGFIAENLREHIKDSNEIKNDIQSMIKDLQSDVLMYNSGVSDNQLSDRRIDTLITLLKTDRSNTSEIYFLARYITANNDVYTPNTKTFDLMKSSAALKLIEPRWLLDSISGYYQSLQYLPSQSALQNQKLTDIHLVNSQLFDGYIFQQMFLNANSKDNVIKGNIVKPQDNPPLLSTDFVVINKIMLAYHYLYATTEFNNFFAEASRRQANRLINLIKKEYHLK